MPRRAMPAGGHEALKGRIGRLLSGWGRRLIEKSEMRVLLGLPLQVEHREPEADRGAGVAACTEAEGNLLRLLLLEEIGVLRVAQRRGCAGVIRTGILRRDPNAAG